MGFFSKLKRGVGYIIDYRIDRWLDIESIKNQTNYYLKTGKRLFHIKRSNQTESFDEAIMRYDLTAEDLEDQSKRFLFYSMMFLGFSFLLLLYAIILLFYKNLMGFSMTIAISIFALTQAFRFHFWYFQMKQKKLGCSFREWFNYIRYRNKDLSLRMKNADS